ncbi:hypothetical protein N7510_008500 [Penicillium lagena]|uniref:uncharacterized protein n=1 Tax=Penicillium lagena TaxID=94218 RepID=UPI0025420932|nr:uncharacterized protein N7510_008500 [Penicillium lagena]KAJ5605719.1 hypothetical protein N7510_008500 [Penicillium lagena]
MPPPESYPIKRPRLALSCIVCRRRKVRCGKEQPQCNNCVRMNEACVYNIGARDPWTGRVQRAAEEDAVSQKASSNDKMAPDVTNQRARLNQDIQRNRGNSNSGDPHGKIGSEGTLDSPLKETIYALPSDYLIMQGGSRTRYISKSFWGFMNGNPNLNNAFFFDEDSDASTDIPPPHISSLFLVRALGSLPTKPVSDALTDAFLVGIYPILPLVRLPTFKPEYDRFWQWCWNAGSKMPPAKLVQDPTFICLLFAILFTGASVAPESVWGLPAFNGLEKQTNVSRLKTAVYDSLAACQHSKYPTLNTLVSSLLVNQLDKPEGRNIEDAVFVSTIIRLAQSMGLHREINFAELDEPSREHRRRLWLYIVWLDVQVSISSGLPPCYGSEALDAVRMVVETRDEDLISASQDPSQDPSVIMLYAIGRYETAGFQNRLLNKLEGAQGLPQRTFQEAIAEIRDLHWKIDTLIRKIPAQGIPEKGFIPFQLANASPQTHRPLYEDGTKEPSVLGAWSRIMLSLLKSEMVIMVQQPFFPPVASKDQYAQRLWNSLAQVSTSYLKVYLQLCRTSAFQPYAWFFSSCYGPRQAALVLLTYLQGHPQPKNSQLARYCVDEFVEFLTMQQISGAGPDGSQATSLTNIALVSLHERLKISWRDRPPDESTMDSVFANEDVIRHNMVSDPAWQIFVDGVEDLSASLVQGTDEMNFGYTVEKLRRQ